MTCEHCNAAEQRGRYCVGCGKLLPPQHLRDDDTQPVLRFRVTPRTAVEAGVRASV